MRELYQEHLLLTEVFRGITPQQLREIPYETVMNHLQVFLAISRARAMDRKSSSGGAGGFTGFGQ